MSERLNGKSAYTNHAYSGARRGVFATPSVELVGYQHGLEQSRFDKERRIAEIRERQRARKEVEAIAALPERTSESEFFNLGNKELPAFKHKSEIINLVDSNKASALGGETGSGKSTQLPQYLLEAGYDLIVMLEPRRIAANFLCDRLRDELADQLDEDARNLVGINHGERTETHESNKIRVMTADTFNAMATQLENDYADKKVAIIADEAHEANIFTEIAMGVAGMAVQRQDGWRLMAVSATQNLDTLKRPFSLINTGGKKENTELPFAEIEGRPHEVEFREAPDKNVMEVYTSFDELPEKTLTFTSGKGEIEHIIDGTICELEKRERGLSKRVVFRQIHGELTNVELGHLNDPVPEGHKLVFVSTPAGMSSITIPGVTHVITDGTINRKELDHEGAGSLQRRYLSVSEILQEIGRAGRDVDGAIATLAKPTAVVEDMLREKGKAPACETMPFKPLRGRDAFAPAEIYNTNLSRAVLRVANLGLSYGTINPYTPHRVEESTINNAEIALLRIGGLDKEAKITDIGQKMDKFQMVPELSRGLVEAMLRERSAQHLARMALIAAGIDVGGIQEYNAGPDKSEWKKFVRKNASDDFILQLDLMTAMHELQVKNEHRWKVEAHRLRRQAMSKEGDSVAQADLPDYDSVRLERSIHFLREHDLNPKRTERALKVAKKTLKQLGIGLNNLVLTPPTEEEEQDIRRDFTSGMLNLVYEETRTIHHDQYYRNILGDNTSTERVIHSYGTDTPPQGSLIAGFPWNQKRTNRNTAEVTYRPVISRFFAVNPSDVAEFAQKNDILTYDDFDSRINGDLVIERAQPMFGSIAVGGVVVCKTSEYISDNSQDKLLQRAFERPRRAQQALRSIADELEFYRKRIPPHELEQYRSSTSLPEITKKDIAKLLRTYAKSTRSLSELDEKLAQYMYSKGIEIGRYYSDDAREEMMLRSPSYITVAGNRLRVYYERGNPYITAKNIPDEAIDSLRGQLLKLDDGREVLLQTQRNGQKQRVSLVVYVNDIIAARTQAL